MVMEKQLSVNSLYSTYRAYRQGDSENLLVRVIEKATRTSEECEDIARKISHLNSNARNDLQVIHSDSKIILVRPYFSQSIKNYLEEKRPTAESAYKTLVNMTEQLRKATGCGLFYESFSLENVFVNSQGEIILSDLEIDRVIKHPAAPTSTKITLGMKSYLKTVYELTCASPYVDGIQEATLSLRDETPQDLHDFVNELIQADSCLKGFADALQLLNKADLQKIINAPHKRPDSQDLLTKKKSSSGSLLKKKAAQGKLKSKNVLKKNRRKTPVSMPLVLTVILLFGATYFVIQDGTIFKQPPKPVVVKKAPEPQKKKTVVPKKTVVKEVITQREIKPLPKIEEVIDMKGHIELQTFSEIMEAKCTSCHGAEGKEVEGKFNLVKLMSSKGIHPKHWQAVYSQIEKNEMPPEDETQLIEDEKIIVLNQLKEMISQTEVTRKSRALTPDEIKNTLVDIFKIDQDTYNPFTPLYANYAQDDFYTTQKSVITPYYLDDLYETLHDALESYVALKPQIDPLNLQATFPKRVPLGWKVGDQTELRWNGTGTYFVQTQLKKPLT